MKYLFPILGLGLTAYGVFFKKDASTSTPTDLASGAVAVVALPAGSVAVLGPVKGVTVYKAPSGGYYAMQGTGGLAMPLTGTNVLSFLQQLQKMPAASG